MTTAACTIISLNYVAYARTLAQSLARHHPEYPFYVLFVDRPEREHDFTNEPFEVVLVEDLGIDNFIQTAFKYDVLELNTNVKPTFLKHLFARGIDQVIYFDPDIQIFSTLDPVLDALIQASIVVTPHWTTPRTDIFEEELPILGAGVFNLGFIALRCCPESAAMLDWWESRCLALGFNEFATGLFVDQKWMNLLPCQFDDLCILKHLGCNVAYWNLHERQLSNEGGRWMVNDRHPLVFYHFSGVALEGNQVSKYTRLYTLDSRPDLQSLFNQYREQLIANDAASVTVIPYAFGRFTNGELIAPLLRSVYAGALNYLPPADPFDTNGPIYQWANQMGLLRRLSGAAGKTKAGDNWRTDWRVRAVNLSLRLIARLVGIERYTRLIQYLAYVSVPRNQSEVFLTKIPARHPASLS